MGVRSRKPDDEARRGPFAFFPLFRRIRVLAAGTAQLKPLLPTRFPLWILERSFG